jgi:hypothetical protein
MTGRRVKFVAAAAYTVTVSVTLVVGGCSP